MRPPCESNLLVQHLTHPFGYDGRIIANATARSNRVKCSQVRWDASRNSISGLTSAFRATRPLSVRTTRENRQIFGSKTNFKSSLVHEVWCTSELYISGAPLRISGRWFHGTEGRSWCSLWYPTMKAIYRALRSSCTFLAEVPPCNAPGSSVHLTDAIPLKKEGSRKICKKRPGRRGASCDTSGTKLR